MAIKKHQKSSFTHQDFITFIDLFLANLKEKNMAELKKMSEVKQFVFKSEIYTKMSALLCEKLISSYRFTNEAPVEDYQFDTRLETKRPIKSLDLPTAFFEENRILEEYRTATFKSIMNEYETQVDRNNKRRSRILKLIPERAKMPAYFYLFDQINGKLEEIQRKKIQMKKKGKVSEIDEEIMKEYLDRVYEFFDVFGPYDQYSDHELNYEDVFDDGHPEEENPEIQFLK